MKNKQSAQQHSENIVLKPLKFPEVPKPPPALHVSAKTIVIVSSVGGLLLATSTGIAYVTRSQNTSIVSRGAAMKTLSINPPVITPTKKPSDVEIIYYHAQQNAWTELSLDELYKLPQLEPVQIAIFSNTPHAGAAITVNRKTYDTKSSRKTPKGYYFVTVLRSELSEPLKVSVVLN